MSGYRCVNYYELCRLCTASHGTKKINIFSEEGRRKNLYEKISGCLPIIVSESDKLPKIVCAQCLTQVETIFKFRETCVNAQAMLESCLNSTKLRNGGKVYIKDVSPKKTVTSTSPPLLKTITNSNTPITIGHTTLTKTPVQNSRNSNDFLSSIIQAVGIQNMDETNETQIINNIQPVQQPQQQQPIQQYTITLDGKTLKSNQIHYKIEPSGAITIQEPFVQQIATTPTQQTTISNNTLSQVNEFLKLKPSNTKVTPVLKRKEPVVKIIETSPNKKPKINLVLANSSVQSQQKVQSQPAVTTISPGNTITVANTANKTQSITLQDLKFLSSGNKCYLPITLKDGSNNDQQVMAQIDTKNLMLPATTYLQMKLEPQQITTVDGQQVVQLTSAGNHLPTSISLAQPQYVQTQSSDGSIQQTTIVPETRTILTGGQNITITQNPVQQQQTQQTIITTSTMPSDQTTNDTGNKIQFATLQNVATPNITLPLPETSAITFQRIKVEEERKSETKSSLKQQQIYKLPTLSNATIAVTNTQNKTTARKGMTKINTVTAAKMNNKPAISIKSDANESRTNASSGGKSDVPTCDICEKVFKRKEHLAQHVKLHLGLRPFKCEQPNCNKAFSRKEHLLRHCVSHTGKKQFDCDICHKLFSRKDNLNKHKKSHEQKQQQQQQPEHTTQPTLVYTVTEVN